MTTETQTKYTNVTLYRKCEFLGNIVRMDCRELTIVQGVKYAQYNNSIEVIYLAKGKKKLRHFRILSYPFLIVVPTSEAISVEDKYTVQDLGNGVQIKSLKYQQFDSQFENDLKAQLGAKGVTILAEYNETNFNTMSDYAR